MTGQDSLSPNGPKRPLERSTVDGYLKYVRLNITRLLVVLVARQPKPPFKRCFVGDLAETAEPLCALFD